MNSNNNWLSIPLSLSLQDNMMDIPNQEWNLNGAQGSNHNDQVIPYNFVDFLGMMTKPEISSDHLVAYNDTIHGNNDTNYNNNMFTTKYKSLMPPQGATPTNYDDMPETSSSNLLSLTLSLGSGKHSTSSNNNTNSSAVKANPIRKTIDTLTGQRTSIYRGVTRHRRTGIYEAHLWDNSCKRQRQSKKGHRVYLGGYDKEENAARAYDMAALKYWGISTTTNFPITNYEKEIEDMKHMTRQDFVTYIRTKASGRYLSISQSIRR